MQQHLVICDLPGQKPVNQLDEQLLALVEVNPTTGYDIWVSRMSNRKAQPFLRTRGSTCQKIAFDSRQSGHPEVYIVDISERMPRKVVTNLSDMSTPSWSHDGKWLYFKAHAANTPDERIFRSPASGGNAVALSAEYGAFPLESYDGEAVYFANRENAATLDIVSLEPNGAQSALIGMPAVDAQSLWTVVPGGIYFVPADALKCIRYFDFATKQVRQIFELDKEFDNSLSVSPDGRWILYSQPGELNADIMLVDHFQ
jgi:Tol biopolymer transport system component